MKSTFNKLFPFYAENFNFNVKFVAIYLGAATMYMVSKKLKKKCNIIDERAALYDASANNGTEAHKRKKLFGYLYSFIFLFSLFLLLFF